MSTEHVNDTGKWLLSFGIHRGTITSRDSARTEHDSETEARQQYRDSKRAYASLGCRVWFASIIAPGAPYATGWVTIDQGEPYR